MNFDMTMLLTRQVSSATAFEENECRLFYDALVALPEDSVVVEVGVEYGRSTSIILQVAKALNHRVVLIEPVVRPEFVRMAAAIDCPFTLHRMTTERWWRWGWTLPYISFLHIDGSHAAEDIRMDCAALLSGVVRGQGTVAFHDYGRDSLPDVQPTVDGFMIGGWLPVARAGYLAMWRRG